MLIECIVICIFHYNYKENLSNILSKFDTETKTTIFEIFQFY